MSKQIEERLDLLEKETTTMKSESKKLNEVKQDKYYPHYHLLEELKKTGRGSDASE